MQITNDGRGVYILINTSSTIHNEWLSFCSWYSIFKNLPESEVVIACARQGRNDSPLGFLWPYKTSTQYFQHKNLGELNQLLAISIAMKQGLVKQPLIVVNDKTFAIRKFSEKLIHQFQSNDFIRSDSIWYFNNHSFEMIAEAINKNKEDCEEREEFAQECSVQNKFSPSFSYFNSQCARFDFDDWVKKYSVPPFAYAHKFKSIKMTVNQNKILDLWKRVTNLYESLK